jgi:hypothetical protein
VPADANRDQLYTALINADKAGDVQSARTIANYIRGLPDQSGSRVSQIPNEYATPESERAMRARAQQPDPAKDSLLKMAQGTIIETPLTLATGSVAMPLAMAIKAGKGLYNFATGQPQEDTTQPGNSLGDLASRIVYKPQTQTSRDQIGAIAQFMDASKLEGMTGLPILNAPRNALAAVEASNALRVPAAAAGAAATTKTKNALSAVAQAPERIYTGVENAIVKRDPNLAGAGAAMTPVDTQRMVTAQTLPVPIQLTRGQSTRDFGQQRFERETAKLPQGEPLRERFADQNLQLVQNFEKMADDTGMTSPALRQTGSAVDSALRDKIKEATQNIDRAYDAARAAGHMSELVDIKPLVDFLEKNRAASINAPILRATRSELKLVDPGSTRRVSINDLEELRKSLRAQIEPGTPNSNYGNQMIGMIDNATKGRGGQLYREARGLYEQFASTFIDKAAVEKITSFKKGTTDRAVALEDVFKHSVLNGSLDDVRAVRQALAQSGKKGEQAWRELQGETLRHIQDQITKSVALDVNGNRTVSPAALDKTIRSLDADGKLEFLFGPQKAQQIRDLNEIAIHVLTSPPGAVNTSNTASTLAMIADMAGIGTGALSLPLASIARFGRDAIRNRAIKRKVDSALNPSLNSAP